MNQNDLKDFYPTPENLVSEMSALVEWSRVNTILEPSAGKGSIANWIIEHSYRLNVSDQKSCIDVIEIDPVLRATLKGLDYHVVYNDFLTFETMKRYDLIIMNPPFSNGEQHLLKAISLMQRTGGQIVCLLNAETINNPFSKTRKLLQQELENRSASISYIENAFIDAERKTSVEIALVYISIERKPASIILDNLRSKQEEIQHISSQNLIDSDPIKALVQRYEFEVKAGISLIENFLAMKPIIQDSLKNEYTQDILDLKLHYTNDYDTENGYIRAVRGKYWEALFNRKDFSKNLTSKQKNDFFSRITEMRDYDFSMYNIEEIKKQIVTSIFDGIEEAILDLFNDFTQRFSTDNAQNIHYFTGWKTNKAYKVNAKVIIPLYAWNSWGMFDGHMVADKLNDINKVFAYLANEPIDDVSIPIIVERMKKFENFKNVDCGYFNITIYKKGTAHITFHNSDLLEKFNIFGCQHKGWLPPSYGKTKYQEMNNEEKSVIDSYEGEGAYNRKLKDPEHLLPRAYNALSIGVDQTLLASNM